MKKIILSALIFGVMTSSAFAEDAGEGRVNFIGSIIDAPCGIDPESLDQTVNLGAISQSVLANGTGSAATNDGTSTPVPFTIQLLDCSDVTAKSVEVTFRGSPANSTNDALAIQGTASGAGVVIVGMQGTPVKIDASEASTSYLQDGDNTLLFSAYLKGLGGTDGITPGSFTSVANFSLTYP